MKILIVTRLNKTDDERAVEAEATRVLTAAAGDGATVHRDDQLDWKELRQIEGSYEGAYRWAARTYDRIVVIEAPGPVVAKGQSSIVEAALAAGTPVAVWHNGRGHKVTGVELIEGGDWKTGYARLVL